MKITDKVNHILHKSKEVISDSALENGAIVAGNSDKNYYPKGAKDYHFVWPREAAFICVAAQLVDIDTIQEPFFNWLKERPEDFQKEGKLFANYSVNGRIQERLFQPDQAGAVLWAIHEFYKGAPSLAKKQEPLIRRLADGLTDDWKEKYFFTNTVDLWGDDRRKTSTTVKNNHTYSLAACARGLYGAATMVKNEQWKKAADQMVEQINHAYRKSHNMFIRNHGKIDDSNVDASLLGLTYPFEIIAPDDQRMATTVEQIEKNLVIDGGVHRFQFDYYDGEGSAQEGGGGWPLLNCWMTIYWALRKNEKKATSYYRWVIDNVESDYLIPEQIFNDFRKGIKPLAWSHAMFIIATHYLTRLSKP